MLNYAQRIRHLWGEGISPGCSVHAACSRESKFDALKCIVLLTGFCFDSGSRNIVYMYPWWLELVGGWRVYQVYWAEHSVPCLPYSEASVMALKMVVYFSSKGMKLNMGSLERLYQTLAAVR